MKRNQAVVIMLLLMVLAAAVYFVLTNRKDQPLPAPEPITSVDSPVPEATQDAVPDTTTAP